MDAAGYSSEKTRLHSLQQWTSRNLFPGKLDRFAKAGFYYKGSEDTTSGKGLRCFCCRVLIGYWKIDDDPFTEHAKTSPRCLHMLVTLGKENIQQIIDTSNEDFSVVNPGISGEFNQRNNIFGIQVCGAEGPIIRTPSCAPGRTVPLYITPRGREFYPPKTPHMRDSCDRRQTFTNFGDEGRDTHSMAEAGLFYNVDLCQVECYYCGQRFNPVSFSSETDPWVVHASGTCFHVILTKGERFLDTWGRCQARAEPSIKRYREETDDEETENVEEGGENGSEGEKVRVKKVRQVASSETGETGTNGDICDGCHSNKRDIFLCLRGQTTRLCELCASKEQ